jgi:hypothetical protein
MKGTHSVTEEGFDRKIRFRGGGASSFGGRRAEMERCGKTAG